MAKEKNELIEQISLSAKLIDHVAVEVEAIIGNAPMTVADLNALRDGDVVKLDTQINEPVSIRVNGKTIGKGEIVTVNDRFAVKITEIGA